MTDHIVSAFKIKNADNSYTIHYPYTSLDAVLLNTNGDKLSSKLTNNGDNYSGTAAKANAVPWSGVTNKPTTVAGYGITDAIKTSDVVTTATANKILKLDSNAKIPASIISGTIPIENLPHGALERCVVVANDTARFALTTNDVQKGDTVKVTDTGKMYFVMDDSKLSTEAGYEIYTVGSAASVAWSGVTGKPTTLSGYGITDAVKSSDVVTSATANKILKLNSNGALPASITGNAAGANKLTTARKIALTGDATGSLNFDGSGDVSMEVTVVNDSHNHQISNISGLQDELNKKAPLASPALTGTPTAPTADASTNNTQIATTAYVTGAISTLNTSLTTEIGKKQSSITGAATTITSSNLTANRAVISNGSGKVATSSVTSTELGYLSGVTSSVQTQLNNRVLTSDVVTAPAANKILKLDSTGKFPVSAIPQSLEIVTYTSADI